RIKTTDEGTKILATVDGILRTVTASSIRCNLKLNNEEGLREGINLSGDDDPIKGRRLDEEEVATKRVSSDTEEIRLDEGEVAAKRVSNDTEEMATVLTTMDAASVLSSGGVQVVP
nr:hypothetical protein [Tanacetum cinerariifolium]